MNIIWRVIYSIDVTKGLGSHDVEDEGLVVESNDEQH